MYDWVVGSRRGVWSRYLSTRSVFKGHSACIKTSLKLQQISRTVWHTSIDLLRLMGHRQS